ncbi:MAG: SDR family oxidoreductase [Chloroflexi bacterium]|nr:SDR family oxidoreductase [Chloroflexota bacterium]
MPDTTFHNNVTIITGASSGIGREMAFQLALQGARLALAARDAAKLAEVAAQCRRLGGPALVVPTDVAQEADCRNLIDHTVATYGRIDTLVNNASISMWAMFEEMRDLQVFDQIMQVNYMGCVYCTYYALPYLKASAGRLVGISSMTGKTGVPTRSGYAASKHAMAGFFDTLRIELAGYGISVTMAYPGFVATEVRQRALGPDGRPLQTSPLQEARLMPVETCVRIILAAATKRQREVYTSQVDRFGLWLKIIAPALVDRIARRRIAQGQR